MQCKQVFPLLSLVENEELLTLSIQNHISLHVVLYFHLIACSLALDLYGKCAYFINLKTKNKKNEETLFNFIAKKENVKTHFYLFKWDDSLTRL